MNHHQNHTFGMWWQHLKEEKMERNMNWRFNSISPIDLSKSINFMELTSNSSLVRILFLSFVTSDHNKCHLNGINSCSHSTILVFSKCSKCSVWISIYQETNGTEIMNMHLNNSILLNRCCYSALSVTCSCLTYWVSNIKINRPCRHVYCIYAISK